jgi:hypothetical protein
MYALLNFLLALAVKPPSFTLSYAYYVATKSYTRYWTLSPSCDRRLKRVSRRKPEEKKWVSSSSVPNFSSPAPVIVPACHWRGAEACPPGSPRILLARPAGTYRHRTRLRRWSAAPPGPAAARINCGFRHQPPPCKHACVYVVLNAYFSPDIHHAIPSRLSSSVCRSLASV